MSQRESMFGDLDIFSDVNAAWARHKAADRRENETRLGVYHQTDTEYMNTMFWHIVTVASSLKSIPERGTAKYVDWVDKLWRSEPILAGGVYSMVAKMQSMVWVVEGGRNNVKQAAQMLSRARYMGGSDWIGFIGSSAIDFYVQDNGVWWDVVRQDGQWGKMTDLAHIDTRCCVATGNANYPMEYRSNIMDDERKYAPGEYIHFTSMPSPAQSEFGLGTSAVSRAARAAKLLMALHDYDAEKLSNLPPEGIASVTGLTDREFRQAIALWQAERKKNNSLTFPQVLWLVGNNPGARVSVDIASFSSIPESFDRQTVVSQYVNTLALCFGVDTREFWAISTGALGTASEAEVQHLKARGKGGGEFISMVESALNAELPEDVQFKFDTQDIEEDMVSANVAKAWIQAYIPLLFPPNPMGEAVIDANTFKRLLAEKGVLPEWAVGDEKVAIPGHYVHKEEVKNILRFIYKAGKLRSFKLIDLSPHLETYVPVLVDKDDTAEYAYPMLDAGSDGDNGDGIRGKPIADDEVDRGSGITAKAHRGVMKWWKDIPELTAYVGTD